MDETGQNVHIFEEVLFFKLCTKEKQKNKQLIQLILCQLDVGWWRKEKGTRLTDVKKKKSVCFPVFMLCVALGRGLLRKFARFVLFHPIKKQQRSFNLLCVLDLFFFFRTLAVNSVSDLKKKKKKEASLYLPFARNVTDPLKVVD